MIAKFVNDKKETWSDFLDTSVFYNIILFILLFIILFLYYIIYISIYYNIYLKWSWTKIFRNDTENLGPPKHTVQDQNFQRGTKIFSTMFEKNGPGPRFSGKIAENLGPRTKIFGTKIPVTLPTVRVTSMAGLTRAGLRGHKVLCQLAAFITNWNLFQELFFGNFSLTSTAIPPLSSILSISGRFIRNNNFLKLQPLAECASPIDRSRPRRWAAVQRTL